MFRIAIRYVGKEKDDVLSATISEDEALRIRGEFADSITPVPASSKSFIVLEDQDKRTIMVRRESIQSVVVWQEDR